MRRWLKPFGVAMLAAVVLAACGASNEDEEELRGFLGAAERETRAFTYVESAQDRWFRAEGALQDDLRWALKIASPRGDLVEMVVVDDALAVRILDAEAFASLGVDFGHPNTTEMLLSGGWVVDPAGAPKIEPPAQADPETREPPDPVDVAVRTLRNVRTNIGSSGQVVEFSLESIEYKPSEDPWEYPDLGAGEVRYDLSRPRLPIREEEAVQAQIQIGEPMFRKISVFVRDGEIYQMCEMVDVEGHEEFVKLREENKQNDYLEGVLEQVREGRTLTPVRQRSVLATFDYEVDVQIELPSDASPARLGGFLQALSAAFVEGIIAPPGPAPTECLRQETP